MARDTEVEVKEALSEIFSLIGVLGPCTEVRLGWRESGLAEAVVADSNTGGVTVAAFEGLSALEVGTTRSVRGCALLDRADRADCGVAFVGVLGCESADSFT